MPGERPESVRTRPQECLIVFVKEEDAMSEVNAVDGDEYEEITSDEVDRIVDALENLCATVDSENIRLILENASNDVWYLVYDDEDAAEAA